MNFQEHYLNESFEIIKKEKDVGNHKITEVKIQLEFGNIVIWEKSPYAPNKENAIVNWYVDESHRGSGEGSKLIQQAIKLYPILVGQSSNKNSLKILYNNRFRPYDSIDASLEKSTELFDDNGGSLLMKFIK